jgi:tetratricopeptide (TPR) repeat protein
MKRFTEAETAYRKAIEHNISDVTVYNKLGLLLHKNLNHYNEAEIVFRKAIKLDPSYANAYNNLAIMLRAIGQAKEALSLFDKILEINPEDFNPYLGIASIKKTLGESAPFEYVEIAHQLIPESDFYNRACLESVCDNYDLALDYLKQAAQKEGFNPAWAWQDPDLAWIRDNPRFAEIVGPKSEK